MQMKNCAATVAQLDEIRSKLGLTFSFNLKNVTEKPKYCNSLEKNSRARGVEEPTREMKQ